MPPCKPSSELWIVSQEPGPRPPPHPLAPTSAQREKEAFFSAPLPDAPSPPRLPSPLGRSQLAGRWGMRGRVESAPEIKRPNKKLIV